MVDRRTFLKGLVATAAGVLVPGAVAAEPERRVWALDRTMLVKPSHLERLRSWQPTYLIHFNWGDGFVQSVEMTHEEMMRGDKIQLMRGGVLSGFSVEPRAIDGFVDLWPNQIDRPD